MIAYAQTFLAQEQSDFHRIFIFRRHIVLGKPFALLRDKKHTWLGRILTADIYLTQRRKGLAMLGQSESGCPLGHSGAKGAEARSLRYALHE